MKPLSLDPIHTLGLSCIGQEKTCTGCGVKFSYDEGVTFLDHFFDQEKNLCYDYIPFCDALCILENWPTHGEA